MMGPADALRAVKMLQPKHVIPYHYSTFYLICQHNLTTWVPQVEKETGAKVHILKPGKSNLLHPLLFHFLACKTFAEVGKN